MRDLNKRIKRFLIIVAALAAVAVVAVSCTGQRLLGSMHDEMKEGQTGSSDISFAGNKGDTVKISLRTTVTSGTVDFVLSASKGAVVAELDRAKALETYVDLRYKDTYTLTAKYQDFAGSFYVKVCG